MSVGGGKAWRRWRNVGGIMSKRHNSEKELQERFAHKSRLAASAKTEKTAAPSSEPSSQHHQSTHHQQEK